MFGIDYQIYKNVLGTTIPTLWLDVGSLDGDGLHSAGTADAGADCSWGKPNTNWSC